MGLFDSSKQKGKKKGNQQAGKGGLISGAKGKGNTKGAGKSTRIASRGQRGS